MTTGRIGTLLLNGKQVGGFLDWRIDTLIETRAPAAKTVATAQSFWMHEDCNSDSFLAKFYTQVNGVLEIAQESKVLVYFPGQYYLDKLIKTELEMVFETQ